MRFLVVFITFHWDRNVKHHAFAMVYSRRIGEQAQYFPTFTDIVALLILAAIILNMAYFKVTRCKFLRCRNDMHISVRFQSLVFPRSLSWLYFIFYWWRTRSVIVLLRSRPHSYSTAKGISLQVYKKKNNFYFLINLSPSSLARSSPDACRWTFHHYSPSPWEAFWYNNIHTLQNSVCSTLAQPYQTNNSIRALQYIIALQKTIFNHSSTPSRSDELLSKIYYQYECPHSFQSPVLVSQSIEPLVGLLRDPLTICSYTSLSSPLKLYGTIAQQSKRFFLLGPSAPFHNFHPPTTSIAPWLYRQGSQKLLFDIGSSYFNGVQDGTSSVVIGMRWFYEYFRSLSLRFDRILAFEVVPYSAQTYWNEIPADLIGSLSFINVGVEKMGKLNPWNILQSIAKEDDYVVVKLDIDKPILENEFMKQVLNDKSISSLIDEMCFEMHVRVNEMIPYWGLQPGELKDSYVLFTKLRQVGIRIHSWP